MKPKSTSQRRSKAFASFLLTVLFAAMTAFSSYAQQPMERVYANDVQKSDDDYLLIIRSGYVENEGNAVDGNPQTAATLNSTGVTVLGINLGGRSEEHTSELQSLMRISYAVFCLKKKNVLFIL